MKNPIQSLRKFIIDRRGVAAVEFALIAPIILFGALYMTDFGLVTYDRMKVSTGIRAASQYVLTGGTNETVIAELIRDGSGIDIPDANIELTSYCTCPGSDVIVDTCFMTCGADEDTTRIFKHIAVARPTTFLFKSTAAHFGDGSDAADMTYIVEAEVRTR